MKTTLSIIGIISILVLIFSAQNGCSGNQDVLNDLQNKHQYLNKRVDTVLANQEILYNNQVEMNKKIKDILKNQDNIFFQLDTLKAGQILIYSEVTEFNNRKETKNNWASQLINWLE